MRTVSSSQDRSNGDGPRSGPVLDGRPRAFVWAAWAAMSLVALICLAAYARNVPLSEDWTLVPPLTGHESNLAEWLWSQNNEHRVPLPRLILLGALKLTGGDFRAGMVISVLSLSALSALLILATRRLRGMQRYSDAFFPVVLLHVGNWENLFWSWQFSFVSSVILIGGLLLFVVTHPRPVPTRAALLAGTALVFLPLTGATGLVFVPVLAVYLVAQALHQWRRRTVAAPRWSTASLIAFPVIALIVTGLYFVSYESPMWYPASGVNLDFVKTSLKFLAIGFGPASAHSWPLSALAAIAVLSCTALLLLSAARSRPPDRPRALGLLLVLAGVLVTAIAVGRGRATLPHANIPGRYVLLAVPALLTAYFAWELYGSARLHRAVPTTLFGVVLLMLPLNIHAGFQWRDWYLTGMDAVERDVQSGLPIPALAERHQSFLLHWSLDTLKANMNMLREAEIGPFRDVRRTHQPSDLPPAPPPP